MKERSIVLAAWEVRAFREGRKTMIRRPIRGSQYWGSAIVENRYLGNALWRLSGDVDIPRYLGNDKTFVDVRCPIGQSGDRLWCKEAWRETGSAQQDDGKVRGPLLQEQIVYRVDEETDPGPWRSAITMPRWASRLAYEVVSVHIERVQDIRSRGAWAEGATCSCMYPVPQCAGNIETFQKLWDSTYAKRGFGWDTNPWVWVAVVKKIEDEENKI